MVLLKGFFAHPRFVKPCATDDVLLLTLGALLFIVLPPDS
jgi:hypothetical protein